MDIQNIDLRRGDFEGMHPKAKLFGFDEDKKLYTGDGVESINDQWTTWCACIGMFHLDAKEAQAVPEKDAVIKKLSDQLYAQEMKASAARVLCETACELLDDYAHQDAMVILDDLEQAMKEPTND